MKTLEAILQKNILYERGKPLLNIFFHGYIG